MTNEFIHIEIILFLFSIISIIIGRIGMCKGREELDYLCYLLGGLTVCMYTGIALLLFIILILDIIH